LEKVMFKRLYGSYGKVDVPAVGVLVGEMSSWDLTRREKAEGEPFPPEEGTYRLQAYFSHITAWMFNDPAVHTRIVIEVGRDYQYRLEVADDARTVLDGQSLLIEGVNLCPV
jgi:hypothetical protein